ncbi:MAG: methyltetrahydrofolate cobalamin methyltransferase [Bacillota bacterium]|nr:methyltetrahydrofolate cobalamin methyltransferase [Bacillota bacterium]
MLIIGEKINTSRKGLKEAVENKEEAFIRSLAKRQVEAGADYIDVNCGTFVAEEPEYLKWLVEMVQDELNGVPLCIDSPSAVAMEAALKVHQGRAIINSISGEKKRFDAFLPLVKKYDCKVILLCMDDSGIPEDAETRFKIASQVIDLLKKEGIRHDDIYVDPLIQPVSVSTKNGFSAAKTIQMVRDCYPAVHAVCGLSNISYGLPRRKILNRAYLVICAYNGLDAVIIDPEDRGMMEMVYASETLLDRDPYCSGYLNAYRKGILG